MNYTKKTTCQWLAMSITTLVLMYMPIINGIPQAHDTWITIFVHGIISIKPHLTFSNYMRFLNDKVENTVYAKTVELIRKDPTFYKNQAMQGFGLQKINMFDISKGNAPGALAQLFEIISNYTGIPPTTNYYYTYGWSGLLSASNRYKDATKLFTKLENLLNSFSLQGIKPKIRLVGYSHGGSVCIELARVHQQQFTTSSLYIDELILIGTPIPPEANYWINDPVFKKIYHVFSEKDRVQVLDIFSSTNGFAYRTFKPINKYDVLPEKLTQIELKVRRMTKHNHKSAQKIKAAKNLNKKYIISGNRTHLFRNASPGHTELWFFGWTPHHYRKTYPLYPLPTISLAPFITYHVENNKEDIPPHRPIIVDIRPEHEVVIIKHHKKKRKEYTVIPFIPQKKFAEIKEHILQFSPDNYTGDIYREQTRAAYEAAREFYEKKIKPRSRYN